MAECLLRDFSLFLSLSVSQRVVSEEGLELPLSRNGGNQGTSITSRPSRLALCSI